MQGNKFSEELQELAWLLGDAERGRTTLTPDDMHDIRDALQRASRIISVLEIRSRSLNNLRDEVNRYMDEFNDMID
jgi:hypothetical protein